MTALLELDNVSKRFGGLQAVRDLSFAMREGEILGLIGPNGAGKSTLFNLINGVFAPETGRIVFDGIDITGETPYRVARHGLARTHQIVQPLANMTVLENCTVGACFGRENLPLARAREVAREAAAIAGLDDRCDMLALHLTIAGKKRLELARALAAQPKLLLLDEVLAGLNPTEIEHMIGVIRRIRERGVTILIIEHLMQAIMSLSDRIVVLNLRREARRGPAGRGRARSAVIEAYLGDPKLAAELQGSACSMAADVLLEVEALEAGYGEVQVLWGLSLKARRGQLTAIVGANGAGKTTTLRAVAGSDRAVARPGDVRGRGRDARCRPTSRRRAASRWCRKAGNCSAP